MSSRLTDQHGSARALGPDARGAGLFAVAILAALVALVMTVGPGSAHAATAKICPLTSTDQEPAGGRPQYNLGLKAGGVTCAVAVKVMRGYHKCRPRDGLNCTKKVLTTWKCTAKKQSSTPLMFYAAYTCKSSGRVVSGNYQQNT